MILSAFLHGIRRVAAAPLLCLVISAVAIAATVLLTAPPDRTDAAGHTAPAGVSHVAQLLGPEAIGVAAGMSGATPPTGSWMRSAAVWWITVLAGWAFLAGGVFDRLARNQRAGPGAFVAAGATHFWRLLRLGVVASLTHRLVLATVPTGPADPLAGLGAAPTATSGFEWGLAAVAVTAGLAVTLLLDYAKVRLVVEARHSIMGAVLASARFIRRRPGPVVGLALLNLALTALVVAAAPAPPAGDGVWSAAVGPLWVVARVVAQLTVYAANADYFQQQLAYRGYVASRDHRPRDPDRHADR